MIPCKKAKLDEQKEPNVKDLQWFNNLKQYVLYYEDEKKVKHCITPITKEIGKFFKSYFSNQCELFSSYLCPWQS